MKNMDFLNMQLIKVGWHIGNPQILFFFSYWKDESADSSNSSKGAM